MGRRAAPATSRANSSCSVPCRPARSSRSALTLVRYAGVLDKIQRRADEDDEQRRKALGEMSDEDLNRLKVELKQ